MDVDRYLERISYDGDRAPTHETLRGLHRAHLMTVPFENLSIHSGETIVLTEDWLFDKIVHRRRGGFCYELNGLFAALCRQLGFRVERLAARVFDARGALGIPFDHMTLRVRLERDYLADVGFGDCFIEPLPLQERTWDDVRRSYRIRRLDGHLALDEHRDEAWKPQYMFSLRPHALRDFEPGCHHHQTSPDSHFTQRRICSRATPSGRVSITEHRRIVTHADGTKSETELDEVDRRRALADDFGVVISNASTEGSA